MGTCGARRTQTAESFWVLFQREYDGIFHHISIKHIHQYVNEFAGRLNICDMDTIQMMVYMARWMVDRRLTYKPLIA